ncbi:ATP synthase F1 subunit delta [Stratiformator vulcanicus]|uniref:ATP synthase subunit delta n=1 Tax=Stratiformator vulcanicus TaxID=2527980 RepID=A0A517R1J7_9PLAN|nr:ATP synthase F1 subunit delta [Stratiformator vulcanicus]QDT37730.1 ATP synthase subunit delta [Stratiformator vulcanicus]
MSSETADLAQDRVRSVMEDPSALSIARVYAQALVEAAGDELDDVIAELDAYFEHIAGKFPEFGAAMSGGMLSIDRVQHLIDQAFAPNCSEVFTNFLRVLAKRERLDLLPLILQQVEKVRRRLHGQKRVIVTTAVPLGDEQLDQMKSRFRNQLPFDPVVETNVKPELIGGMVIQIGDTVYDSSVRARLKQLRSRLREKTNYEIQRGRDRFGSAE